LHDVLNFYFSECLLANPGLCPSGTFRLNVRPTLKVAECTRTLECRSVVAQNIVDWQLITEKALLLHDVQTSNPILSTLKWPGISPVYVLTSKRRNLIWTI
jgi:hypothetical protein